MIYYDGESGFITVVVGPMYSGKSDRLIELCFKAETYGKKSYIAYKPNMDNRYAIDKIVSRVGTSIPAKPIPVQIDEELILQIIDDTRGYDIVAFDEAQFFNEKIIKLVSELAYNKKQVIIDGLNLDYRGREFGFMGGLLSIADEIEKLTAYCSVCGRPANFTQRMVNKSPAKIGETVLVGDSEAYEVRCRNCYVPPEKVE